MKVRRDLEHNEKQQLRVFEAPIVKHIPGELKKEGAFRNEDQADEREVILCRRTESELKKRKLESRQRGIVHRMHDSNRIRRVCFRESEGTLDP